MEVENKMLTVLEEKYWEEVGSVKSAPKLLPKDEESHVWRKSAWEANDNIFEKVVTTAEELNTVKADNVQKCEQNCDYVKHRAQKHWSQINLGLEIMESEFGLKSKWRSFVAEHLKMLRARCGFQLDYLIERTSEDHPRMRDILKAIEKELKTVSELLLEEVLLAPVLVILPSKLIKKKSKIFDFLVNLEGKMPSTGASIYLDLGCQKHAGMFSMAM